MGRHTSTDLNEEDFALGEADRLARQLAEAFNKDYERADLAPEVSVHRTIGEMTSLSMCFSSMST